MDYPGLVPEVTPLAYRFSSSSSFQNRPPVPPTDRTTHPLLKTVKLMACAYMREMLEKQVFQETLPKKEEEEKKEKKSVWRDGTVLSLHCH